MKRIIFEANVFIKNKLGLCNTKGCYKKAIEEVEIECINTRRCLCKKHLDQYKELSKRYYIGIDMAKEEDKTVSIKVVVSINANEVKQSESKSKDEKQLDKLYKLLKMVRKNRVKKKINKRICKLKGNEKYKKHRKSLNQREG